MYEGAVTLEKLAAAALITLGLSLAGLAGLVAWLRWRSSS